MTDDAVPRFDAVQHTAPSVHPDGCWVWPGSLDELIDGQVQDVFDRIGPVGERSCEWRKCMVEPWVSLARVLDGDRLIDWLCEGEY